MTESPLRLLGEEFPLAVSLRDVLLEFLSHRLAPKQTLRLVSFGAAASSSCELIYMFHDGIPLRVVDAYDPNHQPFPFVFGSLHTLRHVHLQRFHNDVLQSDEEHTFQIYQDVDGHLVLISHQYRPFTPPPRESDEGVYALPIDNLLPTPHLDDYSIMHHDDSSEHLPSLYSSNPHVFTPPLLISPASSALDSDDVNKFSSFTSHNDGPNRFTVLCFNIWNFNLPWLERLDMIVSLIERLKPDIIALQEVRYDYFRQFDPNRRSRAPGSRESKKGRFQIESLAEHLPAYQFIFDVSMTYLEFHQSKFRTDEGLAIMSLHPILNHTRFRLSRDLRDTGDEHQRLLQFALVDTPLGPVQLFNTHLTLSQKARVRSSQEIWQHVTESSTPGVPQLLMGDFNSEPDDPLLAYLTQGPGDFQDSWVALHPDDLGYTFESWDLRKRIDFVLNRNMAQSPIQLSQIEIVAQEHQEYPGQSHPLFASDHFGLFATFIEKK